MDLLMRPWRWRRGLALGSIALAACSPEILSGSYYCGPNQACPDGQECSPGEEVCVLAAEVQPFACPSGSESNEPDDAQSDATEVVFTTCPAAPRELAGCLFDTQDHDWYSFEIPGACGDVTLSLAVNYALAFASPEVEIVDDAGTRVAVAELCGTELGADYRLCVDVPVTAGQRYWAHLELSSVGNCGGFCQFNRYALSAWLGAP